MILEILAFVFRVEQFLNDFFSLLGCELSRKRGTGQALFFLTTHVAGVYLKKCESACCFDSECATAWQFELELGLGVCPGNLGGKLGYKGSGPFDSSS